MKKATKCSNGTFPICPNCGRVMAKNACGYSTCILGCGYRLDREQTAKAIRDCEG